MIIETDLEQEINKNPLLMTILSQLPTNFLGYNACAETDHSVMSNETEVVVRGSQ